MDRKNLKADIKNYFYGKVENGEFEIDITEVNADIMKIIDLQDDGWIPVSKKLPSKTELDECPENIKPVIVTYLSYYDKIPCCDMYAVFDEEGVWRWYDDTADTVKDMKKSLVEIVAWKPIPEPYKGE